MQPAAPQRTSSKAWPQPWWWGVRPRWPRHVGESGIRRARRPGPAGRAWSRCHADARACWRARRILRWCSPINGWNARRICSPVPGRAAQRGPHAVVGPYRRLHSKAPVSAKASILAAGPGARAGTMSHTSGRVPSSSSTPAPWHERALLCECAARTCTCSTYRAKTRWACSRYAVRAKTSPDFQVGRRRARRARQATPVSRGTRPSTPARRPRHPAAACSRCPT